MLAKLARALILLSEMINDNRHEIEELEKRIENLEKKLDSR